MFCVAYHSPRLVKLKTAICVLPYLMVAPPSLGKFQVFPTGTHRGAGGSPARFGVCAGEPRAPRNVTSPTGTNEPFHAAGCFCSRSFTNSIVGSVSSELTNCLKSLRFSGSLTTAFHSH